MAESEIMKEIHSIQEKIYEKTKNMSVEERLKHHHRITEEFEKKYGIKLRRAKDRVQPNSGRS